MEFQDCHLQLHERLENGLDDLKKRLDDARKKASTPSFDRAAEAYQQNLWYTEQKLQQHKTLLQWIEQSEWRWMPGTQYPSQKTMRVGDAAPKAVRASCAQKRPPGNPTVLGNVRVSEGKPRNSVWVFRGLFFNQKLDHLEMPIRCGSMKSTPSHLHVHPSGTSQALA